MSRLVGSGGGQGERKGKGKGNSKRINPFQASNNGTDRYPSRAEAFLDRLLPNVPPRAGVEDVADADSDSLPSVDDSDTAQMTLTPNADTPTDDAQPAAVTVKPRGNNSSAIGQELMQQVFDRTATKRPRVEANDTMDALTALTASSGSTESTSSGDHAAIFPGIEGVGKDLPLDWALKRRVRFTSQTSFNWTKSPKSASTVQALTGYVRRGDAVPPDRSAAFQHALYFYEHPLRGWPKVLSDASQSFGIGAAKPDEEYVRQLIDDWSAAVSSLYQLLRAGQCPYFYVLGRDFTALFRANGVGGFSDMSATLSSSTNGLRKRLIEAEVPFTLPESPEFLQSQAKAEETKQALAALEREVGIQTKFSASNQSKIDGTAKSALHFDGYDGVSGLFDFILNFKLGRPQTARLQQPPTLLSPREFLHGSLRACRVRECGAISRTKSSSTRSTRMETVHALEIDGMCMPHTLVALCTLFDKTQDGAYDVHVIEKVVGSGTLNCPRGDADTDLLPMSVDCFLTGAVSAHVQKTPSLSASSLSKLSRTSDGWAVSTRNEK